MTKSELKSIINECIEERLNDNINSITEDTELEIVEESVKDVLDKIKKWVKDTLAKLIHAIKTALEKRENRTLGYNSFRRKLIELLDNAEKALTKSNDIKTEDEAKDAVKNTNNLVNSFNEITKGTYHVDKLDAESLKIITKGKLNKEDPNDVIKKLNKAGYKASYDSNK